MVQDTSSNMKPRARAPVGSAGHLAMVFNFDIAIQHRKSKKIYTRYGAPRILLLPSTFFGKMKLRTNRQPASTSELHAVARYCVVIMSFQA